MDRQHLMLVAVVIIFALIGAVLYFGFFSSSDAAPAATTPGGTAPPIAVTGDFVRPLPVFPFTEADFLNAQDLAVLKDARITAFTQAPGLPVAVPPGSRPNPFAPLP